MNAMSTNLFKSAFLALGMFGSQIGYTQESEPCYGSEVLAVEQGLQTNDQPVAANRSNPEVTLGEPSLDNSAGSFFSLGVGGFIEIGFNGIVLDLPGNDLLVVETSFSGNNCGFNDDEFADIELSQDGINWEFYGTICRNEEIDIADTGLDFITAIRITNSANTNTLDGYDLDGIVALNGCEDFPVEEECYGHASLVYEPGEGNIPADRSNPEQSLGAPERDDTINFVALGFGGTLVIGFDEAAIALPGQDDLEVVETTFGTQTCNSYEERADIYVSQQVVTDASEIDDTLFEYVGESCTNGEFFDVYAATGFEYFTLVKIVDVTPEAAQLPNRDGYDVDGIVALHGCQPAPDPGIEDEPCEGTWRTQTQGGWGSPANGNNPGVYRNANFDGAFPEGLVVGCADGFNLTLTSASAVQAFLPSGGQPAALTADLENPTGNQGSFAGNLTALALSLGFDAYDPEFSDSDFALANLVIHSGTFEGLTVGELFVLASDVFGGCNTDYTPSQLNSAVDAINNAFSGGNSAGTSFVGCPEQDEDDDSENIGGNMDGLGSIDLVAFPNPSPGIVNVEFSTSKATMVTVEVLDMSGRVVKLLFHQEAQEGQVYRLQMDGNGLPNGIYFTKLTTGTEVIVEKVMIAQ